MNGANSRLRVSMQFFPLMRRSFAKSLRNRGKPEPKRKQPKMEKNYYTAYLEKLFLLENGYYLLYLNKPGRFRTLRLYLKYLIPIGTLVYLIKKNPFYRTYPVMLPVMMLLCFYISIKAISYSRSTNVLI